MFGGGHTRVTLRNTIGRARVALIPNGTCLRCYSDAIPPETVNGMRTIRPEWCSFIRGVAVTTHPLVLDVVVYNGDG